jgi:hypothetical protein
MPGMHGDRPQEVEALSTRAGVFVGPAHLATPERWKVIIKVARSGFPATEAIFHLEV